MSSQVNKLYQSDGAKSRSRYMIRSTIENGILQRKDPKDLRALCLPGNSVAEFEEIYDPLDIPRENIVGVERDSKVADLIEKNDLGISLFRGAVEDYVDLMIRSGKGIDFDVFSLDYHNGINQEQLSLVSKISRNVSGNEWVLHHANLAKRDHRSYSLLSKAQLNYISLINTHGQLFGEDFHESLEGFVEGKDREIQDAKIMDLKKLESGEGIEVRFNNYSFALSDTLRDLSYGERDKIKRLAGSIKFKSPSEKAQVDNRILLELMAREYISPRNWVIEGSSRYYYISESGSPMIGDIYHILQDRKIKKIAASTFKKIERNKGDLRKLNQSLRRGLRDFEIRFRDIPHVLRNRCHLGSSARPRLTMRRAKIEVESGSSVEEIRDKYQISPRMAKSLPALVAWRTRRESRDLGIKKDPLRTKKKRDIPLSELEVKAFIEEGIELSEIQEAYPEFTIGQIRAWKAWDTIRKKTSSS